MRYEQVCEAVFLDRPNRFVARVSLAGETVTVHVKNTGRCRELLVPGVRVILTPGTAAGRKTPYDLVAVYKNGGTLFNIDSQAPNRVVGEWLQLQPFDEVRQEVTVGRSRIDFAMKKGGDDFLLEVKGCTLEKEGVGWFPDAPTERGVSQPGDPPCLCRRPGGSGGGRRPGAVPPLPRGAGPAGDPGSAGKPPRLIVIARACHRSRAVIE